MPDPNIKPGRTYQMLPDMDPEQYEALKADIARRGVQVPIDVDEDGNILDGHHRFRAWSELAKNEPPPIIVRDGLNEDEKRLHARKANVLRRHLTREQMRAIIEQQLKETPDRSNRFIASALGVDHKTVGAVRRAGAASGEIPQTAKTIGADGRSRAAQPTSRAAGAGNPFASLQQQMAAGSGGKIVKRSDMPDELKLAFFNAGVAPESIVVVQAPEPVPLDPAVERMWIAFGRFLLEQGMDLDQAGEHIDWLTRQRWTPDAWYGDDGISFRQRCGLRQCSPKISQAWASFDKEAAADAGWPQ